MLFNSEHTEQDLYTASINHQTSYLHILIFSSSGTSFWDKNRILKYLLQNFCKNLHLSMISKSETFRNKTRCLESNEISFLLKSVRFWNIQLLLNVKFLNIWMFFFFVFWQITASCSCVSTDVAFVWFLTSMNVFMLIQLATKLRVSSLSRTGWLLETMKIWWTP